VQVGTANFADPEAGAKVMRGIAAYCERHRVAVRDLIGRVKRNGP
jgi:dihydroorotate dehydrogenase